MSSTERDVPEEQGCTCPDGPHMSDCAVHNGPALPPGPCNCGREAFRSARRPISRMCRHEIRELFERYGFRDQHGHPLTVCRDFEDLVDLATARPQAPGISPRAIAAVAQRRVEALNQKQTASPEKTAMPDNTTADHESGDGLNRPRELSTITVEEWPASFVDEAGKQLLRERLDLIYEHLVDGPITLDWFEKYGPPKTVWDWDALIVQNFPPSITVRKPESGADG